MLTLVRLSVTTFTSNIDFKSKKITRDLEVYFILLKGVN